MLFLAKGRAPVLFNKLRYDGDWNNCRNDVANLTRYASKALEYRFNWQIVDVKSNAYGWLDAPVLFFNGRRGPVRMPEEHRDKIKEYVNHGGLLFAEACEGRPGFTRVVKQLGRQIWPDLQWQRLPDDHPIFTRETQFDLDHKPELQALVDEKGFAFFLLAPDGISCRWHQNRTDDRDAFRLGINVFRYATRGKPIRPRAAQ